MYSVYSTVSKCKSNYPIISLKWYNIQSSSPYHYNDIISSHHLESAIQKRNDCFDGSRSQFCSNTVGNIFFINLFFLINIYFKYQRTPICLIQEREQVDQASLRRTRFFSLASIIFIFPFPFKKKQKQISRCVLENSSVLKDFVKKHPWWIFL